MKLPRFTLRELFLLVVIAAMGCGWWVDRNGFGNRLNAVHAELEESRLLLPAARSENTDLRQLIAHFTIQLTKPGGLKTRQTR
jgi:hypothetical protein